MDLPERKGPRLSIDDRFIPPGFSRQYEIKGAYEYLRYIKPTEYRIGENTVSKLVLFERELGEKNIKINLGIHACTPMWTFYHRQRDLTGLVSLEKRIKDYEFAGLFKRWILNMVIEHERGEEFVNELIPTFLERFPEYGTAVDLYDAQKSILFLNSMRDSAVAYRINPNEFTVSVGELFRLGMEDFHSDSFSFDDESYGATNWRAVWYPTKSKSTRYQVDDEERKKALVLQSFDKLHDHLEHSRQYNRAN